MDRSLPGSLVAVVFILSGAFSALHVLVGFGLLRRSRGWRKCGLVLLWVTIGLVPVVCAALNTVIATGWHLDFVVTRVPFQLLPRWALVAGLWMTGGVVLVISLWQYYVLTRPVTRELFGLPPR